MPADPIDIDAELVRRLIATQFPQWAGLPVRPVEWDGWDNRSFHLGEHMKVRLPSAERYVAQVEKEYRWLPTLAPFLPLPIPVPLALGAPAEGYPWPWAVYEWLAGDTASIGRIADLRQLAQSLAAFLAALWSIDPAGGPPAGPHNFFRGGPLGVYDAETRESLRVLGGKVDAGGGGEVWDAALAAAWHGPPVWVHGDVAVGNLLIRNGRLSAVIDFGSSAVGDPACDLVIAWTFLDGKGREAFREAIPADPGTWARARGWALWKALITLAHGSRTHPAEAPALRVVESVLADHRQAV